MTKSDLEQADTEVTRLWLNTKIKQQNRATNTVALLKLLEFSAQCCAFIVFSYLLAIRLNPNPDLAVYSAFFKSALSGLDHSALAHTRYIHALYYLLAALTLALVLKTFAFFALQYAQSQCSERLEQEIDHALSLGQKALLRKHSDYYWQQLKTDHLQAVVRFLTEFQTQKRIAVVLPVLLLLVIAYVNWFVCLILTLCLPVVPLFMYIIGRGTKHVQMRYFLAFERLGNVFSNRLANVALVNIFSAEKCQVEGLRRSSEALNTRTLKVLQVAFLNQTVLDFFSTLSMALIAVFVGFNLLGELNIGPKLVFADGLFLLITTPMVFAELKQLGHLYHQKSAAEVGAEMIAKALQQTQSQTHHKQYDAIDWQNFYLIGTPIHAPHLSLKQGQHVLLSANSGAGKTLLFEALSKQRGASHQTTQKVALLSQSPCILRSSIRENLHLGKVMSDAQLIQALVQVELGLWYAQLAQGLDTPMSECPPLSGGEQQRLNLARLLLVDADIYLLDEPTAFLSQAQHERLSRVIEVTLSEKTVVWACHKPLSLDWFDTHWQIDAQGKVASRAK